MVAAIRKIERNERDTTDVLAGVRSIGELLPQVLARYRLPPPDATWGRMASAEAPLTNLEQPVKNQL